MPLLAKIVSAIFRKFWSVPTSANYGPLGNFSYSKLLHELSLLGYFFKRPTMTDLTSVHRTHPADLIVLALRWLEHS